MKKQIKPRISRLVEIKFLIRKLIKILKHFIFGLKQK